MLLDLANGLRTRIKNNIDRLFALNRPAQHQQSESFFYYKGFAIPMDLLLKTGTGPDSFDPISRTHINNVRRFVGLQPAHHVLEIGCGIGKDAIPLTEILSTEGSYVGIDIIKPSIDWCQSAITSKFPRFRFHHYDVRDLVHNPRGTTQTTDIRLPVADQSIDRIILQSVFTHMFEPDILHYLREFRRVLKDDGRVYATLFLYDDAILATTRRISSTPFNLTFEHLWGPGCRINTPAWPTGAVAYTEEAFEGIFEAAGLRQIGVYGRGLWSGFFMRADCVDGQDVVVLAKAES